MDFGKIMETAENIGKETEKNKNRHDEMMIQLIQINENLKNIEAVNMEISCKLSVIIERGYENGEKP